jgi:hypothetical protein
MREQTAFKNQLLVSVFCYILVVGFIFFNVAARIGFVLPVKEYVSAAGLSFFFCSLGVVTQLINRKSIFLQVPYITLAAFFLICVLSFFPDFLRLWTGYLVAGAGWLLMLYVSYLTWISFTWKHQLYFSVVAGFFAIWCVSTVYYHSGYVTPLFREELAVGIAQIDLLFHLSIAQMIKTYGVVSTGLDGLTVTPYHYGSHWIFARLSTLFNFSMTEIYNIFYPVVFIVLFYYWLFQGALKVISFFSQSIDLNISNKIGRLFWFTFFVLTVGLLSIPAGYNFGIDKSYLNSQSYLFSLIFLYILLFLVLEAIENNIHETFIFKLIVIFITGIIYLMKMSVGFMLIPIFAYIQFRNRQFFKLKNVFIWFLGFIFIYPIYRVVSEGVQLNFTMFHYIRNFTDTTIWYLFIPVYFTSPLIYCLIRLSLYQEYANGLYKIISSNKFIDIEILIIFIIISLLPGAVLLIPGNSANYFSDVPRQLGVVLVLGCVPFIGLKLLKYNTAISKLLLITFIITFAGGFFTNVYNQLKWVISKNFDVRYAIAGSREIKISKSFKEIQAMLEKKHSYQFITLLDSLNSLNPYTKYNTVIYIPRDQTYYNWIDRISSPFIVPAISGIALINGLPQGGELRNDYSFSLYMRRGFTFIDTLENPNLDKRLEQVGLPDKKIITLHTDFKIK